MKDYFNVRSLIFYSTSICAVVVLFTVTTAYGERNLQAPRPIHGRYPLVMQVPTECLQAKPVYLLLQQSGIFLTGSLLAADTSEQATRIARERPSLSGQWQNDHLSLTGALGRSWDCVATVKLEGKLSGDTLKGALSLSPLPIPIPFTGDREVMPSAKGTHAD